MIILAYYTSNLWRNFHLIYDNQFKWDLRIIDKKLETQVLFSAIWELWMTNHRKPGQFVSITGVLLHIFESRTYWSMNYIVFDIFEIEINGHCFVSYRCKFIFCVPLGYNFHIFHNYIEELDGNLFWKTWTSINFLVSHWFTGIQLMKLISMFPYTSYYYFY